MKPVALDTNAYAALHRGDVDVLTVLGQAPEVIVSAVVIGELLAGFACGSREAANRKGLAEFLATPGVRVAPITDATADNYALTFAALRRRGKPIPTNDLWIAAGALEHGAALLTFDEHFRVVEGLRSGHDLATFLP